MVCVRLRVRQMLGVTEEAVWKKLHHQLLNLQKWVRRLTHRRAASCRWEMKKKYPGYFNSFPALGGRCETLELRAKKKRKLSALKTGKNGPLSQCPTNRPVRFQGAWDAAGARLGRCPGERAWCLMGAEGYGEKCLKKKTKQNRNQNESANSIGITRTR